ncbi:MAG: histidinol-phosphate transaminase [Pseudomonadota bacterium]
MLPLPQPGILDIDPYQGGAAHAVGANRVTKLSSNENPLGPSPAARAAVVALAERLALYPSGDHGALRTALGEVIGLDPDRILCGAGSDEVIALLCQAYVGPGLDVLYTEHGFAMYRISALAAGARPIAVPERARVADVDALLAAVTPATRLVFLANPNNPTGTMIPMAEIERLVAGLPADCLLVLDGAYAEYVPGYDAGAALVEAGANVVMTRTFSKIFGLGGLRIGYAYAAPGVIDVLNRVRGPFNVSSAGLAAAEAAIRDTEWTEACRRENARWRAWLTDALRALGLAVDTSEANFVLPRFRDAAAADGCAAWLAEHGILVRGMASYGLPEALRITVGDEVACRRVAALIGAFLEAET